MTETQPFVISLLQQMLVVQAETNTLLRRIVSDEDAVTGTLFGALRAALYTEYPPQNVGEEPALLGLGDVLRLGVTGNSITPPLGELLAAIQTDAASTATATVNSRITLDELLAFLVGRLGGGSLSQSELLSVIAERLQAPLNGTPQSAAQLLSKLVECGCEEPIITPDPNPAPLACPLAFRDLTGLEWFNPSGLELVQGAAVLPAFPSDTYDVYVAVMPYLSSSIKSCSIAPVAGEPRAPVTGGVLPAAFGLWSEDRESTAYAALYWSWCGVFPSDGDAILMDVINAQITGVDGNIGGTAERTELLTRISDDSTGIGDEWYNAGTAGTGIGSIDGGTGMPQSFPSATGLTAGNLAYIAIRSDVAATLTPSDIRTSWYFGFADFSGGS